MSTRQVHGMTERIKELVYSTDESMRSIGKQMGVTGTTLNTWQPMPNPYGIKDAADRVGK